MRWAIFMGIALPALLVIAVAIARVVQVVSVFAPVSAAESRTVATAAPYVDDPPLTRSPPGPSIIPNPPVDEAPVSTNAITTPAPPENLGKATQVARATGIPGKRQTPPKTALDQDLRPVMEGMKDSADLASQVESLAHKVGPELAQEVLTHSADNAVRNADVERELLETLKEQKQILSGQRPTVDTMLKDTR
jgi:hypothetical protein